MRIIAFSIRRPVTVFVFCAAAVVFGLVAFDDLAVDLLPDITYPSLSVRTEYEGAAPTEVEALITKPLEDAVGVVNNVVKVSSSSRTNLSEITLEFGWGTNMDLAALDVRERLDLVQLPDGAGRPVLLRYDPSLDPVMRIGLYGDDNLTRLRLIAEQDVKRLLERVEGVAAVLVSGGLEEEIHVDIDERRVTNLGLSVNRIITRLAQENVNLTGGRLEERETQYLVRTINEFERPADIGNVVVDNSAGAIVRLEDVADIYQGHKERDVITRIAGQESVEIAIYKEGGTNTVTVVDDVLAEFEALRAKLAQVDPGLRIAVISDQARYIRQSVQEVMLTAVIGGSLAVFVLLLFLRDIRTTIIIATSIPISVIATFFLMYLSDISLNIMSLGGLTLGIGLLVDNSIVVLESIQRKREEGLDIVSAAQTGASEVGQAVIASTLTTVCVFVPIVFVEGIAGQIFGDQALTVTYSLSISLFVALTLIPMLASRQWGASTEAAAPPKEDTSRLRRMRNALFAVAVGLARTIKLAGRAVSGFVYGALYLPGRAFDAGFGFITNNYPRALDAVLRRRGLTLAVTFALLAASLFLFGRLGRELVPELVQGEFFVNTELPPGTHLEVTSRRLGAVEAYTRELDGVAMVYAIVGASNEQGGVAGERRENIGQLNVTVAGGADRDREESLMGEIRPALDRDGDMTYRFGRPSYFSFRTPIEVEIRGFNLKLLKSLADELTASLRTVPGLADIKSSTEGGTPELQIRFHRERLATFGYNVNDIAALVRAKVLGVVATDINREDRTIDIRLRSEERFRDSPADLANLNIAPEGTVTLPLSSVADIVEVEGPAEIRRADGDRVALVSANLVDRDLGSASEEIEEILQGMTLPAGFDWRIGGQRQEMETSFQSLRFAILLAVFMVYLVMASQFESLLHPFVILFSVPFSIVGVLVTLFVFDVTVSVVVLIGVILLAGIVVNNAIVLVDYTNRLRRSGQSKWDALRNAGPTRLRPILMTTSTTVLGLLPMAVGLGEGSELRAPMALTVIGGLLTSTGLTLLLIPVVYSLLERDHEARSP